jgi:hypothetical protein
MTGERLDELAPSVADAVKEIEGLVRQRYPSATFQVARAADEPESILLWTTVDVDDPDEVGDLVLDRLLEMQIDEGIPLHLVPIRTPERVLAELRGPMVSRRRLAKISAAIPENPNAM